VAVIGARCHRIEFLLINLCRSTIERKPSSSATHFAGFAIMLYLHRCHAER
jgi:hypothetical protein